MKIRRINLTSWLEEVKMIPLKAKLPKKRAIINFIEAKDVIKSDSMQELISKSLNLTQRKANSPLLGQPFGKSKKQHKARGSYSYSKIKKDPTKKGQIDLDSVKRNSQTYHSLFKN